MSDLVTMRLFVRTADSGSLSEAARQLNLALAAASRRIAVLEQRYRVTLFHRSKRGLTPTEAGLVLLASARQMLEQAQAMDADMADFAGGVRGHIRLQTNPSAIIQFLPADLASFARRYPDIRLDLEENVSTDIVEAIRLDRADLGIVIEGTETALLETLPYRSDRLALLAPKGQLGGRSNILFSEVYDREFVGLLGSTALTRKLVAQAALADRKLRLRMQVRSFDGVCRMVEAGFGLGVLPEIAARAFAAVMALDVAPLADDWAVRRMLICLPVTSKASSLARNLARDLVSSAAKDVPADSGRH